MNNAEFEKLEHLVKETGLKYKAYPNNYLINVTDVDGVIQSYYTSTGTAIFRDGNDIYISQKHTEHNMPLEHFLKLCSGELDILQTYFSK